jgi:hypothetical protein
MSDLRNHLFETLEALKDKDDPMEIERAKAISDVSQTIIASAKVELQAMELLGLEEPAPFFDHARLPQPSTSRHA